ncbi:serine/threonine protein kinase [[Emmonsia] crescens]|uniref:EKC/KEOPS complex subunit BUD32 n=1 Tax=[Emmonsia] crescens TaxID=73230 RepID=A0A2B7ZGC5_9EURO|nr:serine/threonine protein kinase [Emmonsia crescens]
MLTFTHPIRWPIWSTLWCFISVFTRSIVRPFQFRLHGSAEPGFEDVEQYTSIEKEIQHHAKPTPPKDSQTHIDENRAVAWNGSSELVAYDPLVKDVLEHGSTSIITRIKPGVVLKSPRYSWWHSPTAESHDSVKHVKHSFNVEEQILGILGDHPRIIKFLGPSESPRGLLFVEANAGNLQTYLDHRSGVINSILGLQWCSQAAEAIQYIHQKDVIHSDLRPENYLLHKNSDGILNLFLSDFGGSTSGVIDGGHLPDSGFFNPRKPWVSTKATDIFSLGSVFYTIMTGHWPYKSAEPFGSLKEKLSYGERVDELFSLGMFPQVEGLIGGDIIQGCWMEQYGEVETIVCDQGIIFKEISLQAERHGSVES